MNIALQRMARRVARVGSASRAGVLLRLLFGITLLEAALWTPLWAGVLFGVGALWFMAWQLRQSAGTLRSMGLGLRGFTQASWPLLATVLLASVILASAYFSGSLHRLWGVQHWWWAVTAYAVWALVQEFMLQCFCLRMLRAMVSRVSSLLLSGVVFAVAHLPNPSLTLITFFAGVAFTAIYARQRNLYVVALIHAVLGLTLAVSAPEAWFHELRVGRDFIERPSAIAADVTVMR
jgi:membrane protease YdiL (CAAX protease family)